MTNKEATYILEDIKRSFATREDGTLFTATYNALNKAIKLLEQMPDEHGDLVCYDEVKEEFDNLLSYMEETPDEISNVVWFRREYIIPRGYEMKFHVIVKAERKDDTV